MGRSAITPDGLSVLYLANGNLYRVASAGGASTGLDAPLGPDSFVVNYKLSADGSRAVFLASSSPGVYALHAVTVAGGPVSRLGVPHDGPLAVYEFSPDGAWVVFPKVVNGARELFSVPFAGGPEVQLSAALGASLHDFRITADGLRVVYVAGQSGSTFGALYSAPVDGSAPPLRLNQTLPGTSVVGFVLASASQRVVYKTLDSDLFSTLVAGGPITKLNKATPNGRIGTWALSPDGQRVVYLANHLAPGNELFSVPSDGSSLQVRLQAVPAGGAVEEFLISPDSLQVVFHGDALVDGRFSLFRVPIAGGASLVLATPPITAASLNAITPDSTHAVFTLFNTGGGLFSVALAGGPIARLADSGERLLLTPDSQRVLCWNGGTLRSAPVDGSAASTALLSASFDCRFYLSPNGRQIFLEDQRERVDTPELYRLSITGGRLTKLSVPLDPLSSERGSVGSFQLTSDQKNALYEADQDVFGQRGLYGIHADGSLVPQRLDRAEGTANKDILGYELTRDGRRLVYLERNGATFSQTGLFSRPIGAGPFVRLDSPAAPAGGASAFVLDPSARRVAYLADEDGDGRRELRGIPIAGGASAIWSGALAPGAEVLSFDFTPDGERILYLADEGSAGGAELFSRSTSSLAAVRLSLPAGAGERVESFQVSPDGAHVVFRELRVGNMTLASVPPTGNSAPVRFTFQGEDLHPKVLQAPAFGPDRVVFLAFRRTNTHSSELYSAPFAGGDAVRLSQGASFAVADFRLSADGGRVLYRFTSEQLFSVPMLGGSSAAIGAGLRALVAYEFTPDSSRVLFVGFDTVQSRIDLLSADVLGGANTRLSGDLGIAFPFTSLYVQPQGVWAGFLAQGDRRLYAVRTDGLASPQLVSESTSSVSTAVFGRERIFYLGRPSGGVGSGTAELFSRSYSTLALTRAAR